MSPIHPLRRRRRRKQRCGLVFHQNPLPSRRFALACLRARPERPPRRDLCLRPVLVRPLLPLRQQFQDLPEQSLLRRVRRFPRHPACRGLLLLRERVPPCRRVLADRLLLRALSRLRREFLLLPKLPRRPLRLRPRVPQFRSGRVVREFLQNLALRSHGRDLPSLLRLRLRRKKRPRKRSLRK